MAGFGSVLKVIYPDQCVSCDALTDAPHGLCGACWKDTPFLFGPSCRLCGTPLLGGAGDEETPCDDCLASPPPWSRGWAVTSYEGQARSLILKLKHADRMDLARPASTWMAERLTGQLSNETVVVPVPSHRFRFISRRYNQAALLARGVAVRLGLELAVDALVRTVATPKLDGMSADQRFRQLDGAIALNMRHKGDLKGRPVLVVDDVMTSGATLSSASQVLKSAGVSSISVIVLARVLKTP